MSVSFLIRLQVSAYNFIKKESLTQVFSCEFRKISKDTFSYKTPMVAASDWISVIYQPWKFQLIKNVYISKKQNF